MRSGIRIIFDEHIRRPSEVSDQVTVDIDRVARQLTLLVGLSDRRLFAAFEVNTCGYFDTICSIAPVIYVQTQVTGVRNSYRIQTNLIPGLLVRRVHITMLPVKYHRIHTCITGGLRSIQTNLQILIGLHAYIKCDRIVGDETMQQTIHKLRIRTGEIESLTGFLNRFLDQLTNRFGTMSVTTVLIDRAFTNRHLAIHLILESSRHFDRSLSVQVILEGTSISVDIVILNIRYARHIPVFLIISRYHIIYVRHNKHSLFLLRINRLRSIRSVELGLKYQRIRGAELDIQLYVT